MATSTYVPASHVFREFDISRETLINWADSGLVDIVRLPGSQKRLYHWAQLKALLGAKEPEPDLTPVRVHLAYARVSSDGQRADLERQVAHLQSSCQEGTEVLSDIGSGLNFKRRAFTSLLERVQQGTVKSVTVAHRDRLCRYGIELVEQVFAFHKCELVVLHDSPVQSTPGNRQQELAEDLLAIVNVFVARNNGLRAGENRRRRQADLANQEVEGLPNEGTEADPEPLVLGNQVDIQPVRKLD